MEVEEKYPKVKIYKSQLKDHKYVLSVEQSINNKVRAIVYDESDEDDPSMVAEYKAFVDLDEAVWDMKDLSERFNNARIECVVIKREIVKLDWSSNLLEDLKRLIR